MVPNIGKIQIELSGLEQFFAYILVLLRILICYDHGYYTNFE